MKKLLFLMTLCIVMAGCDNTDSPQGDGTGLSIDDSLLNVEMSNVEETKIIRFTAYENWTVDVPVATVSWCEVTPRKGNPGNVSVSIKVQENTTGADRGFTITLKAGAVSKEIVVTQKSDSQIVVNSEYHVKMAGGELAIEVKTNTDFITTVRKSDMGWIKVLGSESGGTRALDTKVVRLQIEPAVNNARREGKITFTAGAFYKDVTIAQDEFYESTDFDADGTVVTLNKAEVEGSRIQVVFMGDGFSDRQIADGTYGQRMKEAMDAMFWLEPYKTFKPLFNVYYVNVVSKNEGYYNGSETALEGKGPADDKTTIVEGNDTRCYKYAEKIPNIDMEQVMVVVIMNKKAFAGTNYPSYSKDKGDYGMGRSIAYFPLGRNAEEFQTILCHEVCGHGIAKLGDEYFYSYSGAIPPDVKSTLMANSRDYGWNKNLDVTGDHSAVKWSHFLTDSRYANKVGVFEGGNIYKTGVFRPTEDSMMNTNLPFFNAPSREAIYYRIHKLAYGESWVYDYEKFVEYDEINRNAAAQAKLRTHIPYDYPRLPSPIIRN